MKKERLRIEYLIILGISTDNFESEAKKKSPNNSNSFDNYKIYYF